MLNALPLLLGAAGVNRSTVSYRLQVADARLRRPLASCMADLEVALACAGAPPVVPAWQSGSASRTSG